ncbi:MAG: VCBS domain-containing protein [Bradyrhizobium sp.]
MTFVPGAGFSGQADFEFQADDGFNKSAIATVKVDVSSAALVTLNFENREPRLGVGGTQNMVLVGDFEDQQDVVLPSSYISFQTLDSSVALVSATGQLQGLHDGTTVLLASSHGVVAATAVTVGVPADALGLRLYNQGIDLYPLAVSLSSNGGTRQLDVHPGNDPQLTTDLAPASAGTLYFVDKQGVVSVSADGLMTAIAPGTATVTIINGAAEVVVPVKVQVPQLGNVAVGADGAVVQGSDGSTVAVPPGDLTGTTTVSITPAGPADLPQALPDGFHYAAAFNLNVGPDPLNVPVQLAIKVDPSIAPGTKVYFFQAGDYLNSDGTTRPIWWQVENGIVGADGYAHTNSPPYNGVTGQSLYMVAYGSSTLGTVQLTQALASQTAFTVAIASAAAGGFMGVLGVSTAIGVMATIAVPSAPTPQPFLIQVIPQEGLPVTTTSNFQVDPDAVNEFQTNVQAPPTLSPNAPEITGASVAFAVDPTTSQISPEVVLTGSQFVGDGQSPQDLTVTFTMPGNPGIEINEIPKASSTGTELHVAVPDTITLGIAQITITRPDEVPVFKNGKVTSETKPNISNVAKVNPNGTYVFVTLPEAESTPNGLEGDLGVIDGDPSSSTFGQLVAKIPLEKASDTPYPRDVAVTPDNSRAYVTLLGSGRVAVVDTVTLQEIDVGSSRPPLVIKPHAIAAPNGVAVDPQLHNAVLTSPIDLLGTVNVSNLEKWTLELAPLNGGASILVTSGTSKVSSDALAKQFDPSLYPTGFYRVVLTATDSNGTTYKDDSAYVDLEANPTYKEIRMPFGAQPYGIAIDPAGKYAYVAAHNPYLIEGIASSYIFQIDIDPASPTYNQVVRNIAVGSVALSGVDQASQDIFAQSSVAPSGFRNLTVSSDGLHVFATAPNEHPDPNAANNFTDLPGNLIDIDLTQTFATGAKPKITVIPGASGTYGVVTAPPGSGSDVGFTNSGSDGAAVFVTHLASGQKVTIPFDLDKYTTAGNSQLSVHNAGGIVFASYNGIDFALVAGRADQVTSVFGGGFNGSDLNATGDDGFLDQTANPLYEDGNIGIIVNPFSTSPQLVAATRPIPFGFPVDLAISDDGRYLYVSYQGLPTTGGEGGVLVYDVQQMLKVVVDTINADHASLLRKFAVDDLPLSANNARQPNPLIDIKADYLYQVVNGQGTFGVPQGSTRGPIATGGFPGGIATEHSPTPNPVVYKQVADDAAGNANLLPGLNLAPTTNIEIPATRVDELDDEVVNENGGFIFSLDIKSKVTLLIDGKVATNVSDASNPGNVILNFEDVVLDAGVYDKLIDPVANLDPSLKNHAYVLTVTAYNASAPNAPGKSVVLKGLIVDQLDEDLALPPGHQMVDGVDLWDGHLVVSEDDVTIPGNGGLSLDFGRTYSSQGDVSGGPLGAGWSDTYSAGLVIDDKGMITVTANGTGGTFGATGHTDAALAAIYNVPSDLAATALFFDPQPGYHTVLVQPDKNKEAYDFYTAAHVRYHFQLDPDLAPYGKTFVLQYIEDVDGNRIDLYYTNDATIDPRVNDLAPELRNKLDDDPTTLDVVKDSADRAFVFTYQNIFGSNRIVELQGYDPASPNHDLEGLDIKYNYDDGYGNLTSVVRQPTLADKSDLYAESYTYTPGDERLSHNMLSHTIPSNSSAFPEGETTTYEYYAGSGSGDLPTPGSSPQIDKYFESLNVAGERILAVHMPGGATGTSDESVVKFQYDFGGKTRTVSDPRPDVAPTVYTLNEYGSVTKVEAPDGLTTTMVWATPTTPHPEAFVDGGKQGKDIVLVSETDALGRTTTFKYDNLGNAVQTTITSLPGAPVTDASGNAVSDVTSSATYDPIFDEVVSATDAEGHTTTSQIDPVTGHVMSTSDEIGSLAAFTYAQVTSYDGTYGPGDLTSSTDSSGNVTKYLSYDAYGNPTVVVDPAGIRTTRVFDARGRLIDQSDQSGYRVHYEYDGLNRLVSETVYDDLLHTTASLGVDWAERTTYTYFAGGAVKSTTNSLNQEVDFEYDKAGRLVVKTAKDVKQADGSSVTLKWQYSYDEDGNIVRDLDAGGDAHQYTYDGLQRLTSTTLLGGSAGTPTNEVIQSSTYNAINKLTDTDLHNNTTTYTYDGLYRVVATTVDLPGNLNGGGKATATAGYDLVGNKIFIRDGNGNGTTYSYNADYTLKSAIDSVGNETDYTYIDRRLATQTSLSTGLKTTYSDYDGYGEAHTVVETVVRGGPGDPVDTFVTTYDPDYFNNTSVITDPNGNKTLTQRDGLDRLHSQIVDVGGLNLTTTYTYDGDGNVLTVSDPWNNDVDVTYTYDGLDRQIAAQYVQTPDDQVAPTEQFFYDGNGNLIRYVDKRGNTFVSTFDNLGRLLTQTDPGLPVTVTKYAYDDAANSVTTTDPNGNQTTSKYDPLGRVILTTDPYGNTISYTYDAVNLRSVVDKNGNETRYTYDASDRLILTENAASAGGPALTTVSMIYDDQQNQVITRDGRYAETGEETVDQYDSLGRLVKESVRGPGLSQSYQTSEFVLQQNVYDGDGNLTFSTDANGNVTHYVYDGANRRIEMIEAEGTADQGTTTYDYAPVTGNLTILDTGPNGTIAEVTDVYDARHRLVSETNGNGEKTTYTYDENDDVTSATDPLGRRVVYQYDGLGTLTSVDESGRGGGITQYIYDGDRNLRFQIDPDGHETQNVYDKLDRLTDTTLADGQHWQYGYDANGNQNRIVDPLLQLTVMTFDYLNRTHTVTYSGAVLPTLDYQPLSFDYEYDGDGNEVSATEVKEIGGVSVTEHTTYAYDDLNRLISSTFVNDSKTIKYTYDKAGNRSSVTDTDGLTTTYQYDHRNRVHTVTTEDGVTRYEYYQNGLLKMVVYPNGTVADYGYADSYDRANRVTHVVNRQLAPGLSPDSAVAGTTPSAGQLISSFVYTYDDAGNRLSQTETHAEIDGGAAETTTYSYDGLDRLHEVKYSNGGDLTYTYDNNGNRLSQTGTDPTDPSKQVNLTYSYYPNSDRLMSVTDGIDPTKSVTYQYDADGNRVAMTTNGLTVPYYYNILNELVLTSDLDGNPIKFDYDWQEMRSKKVSTAGETRYLYDDGATLEEYDGATGQTLRKYNYGADLISITDVDPATHARSSLFYVVDGMGSTSELTDESGHIQITYVFDAWGNLLQTVGTSDNPKLYTGQDFDPETGLQYFGARFYDSHTGSFITQDSFTGSAESPPSLNRYVYTDDNPLRYTDPTGHDPAEVSGGYSTDIMMLPGGIDADFLYQDKTFQNVADVGEQFAGLISGLFEVNTKKADNPYVEFLLSAMPLMRPTYNMLSGVVSTFSARMDQPGGTGGAILLGVGDLIGGTQLAEAFSETDFMGKQQSVGTRIGKGIIGGTTLIMTLLGLKGGGASPKGATGAIAETSAKLGTSVAETGSVLEAAVEDASASRAPPGAAALERGPPGAAPDFSNWGAEPAYIEPQPMLPDGEFVPKEPPMARPVSERFILDQGSMPNCGARVIEALVSDYPTIKGVMDSVGGYTDKLYKLGQTQKGFFRDAAKALTDAGLPDAHFTRNVTLDQIVATLKKGHPVAVDLETGIFDPVSKTYSNGGGHFVIVDQINFGENGARTIVIRNSGYSLGTGAPRMGIFGRTELMFTNDFLSRFQARGNIALTGVLVPGGVLQATQPIVPPDLGHLSISNEQLSTIADAAQALWNAMLPPGTAISINVQFTDLPGTELGEARIDSVGTGGLPTTGTIFIDSDAGGTDWYVDSTPSDHSEFDTALNSDAFLATGNSAAAGKYDLLTVLMHEEGHLLGLSGDIPAFAAHVGIVDGSELFAGPGFTATLTSAPDDDHLDSGLYPNDLMTASLAPSERRLPSALDAEIIDTVRNAATSQQLTSQQTAQILASTHASDLVAEQLPVNWTSYGTTSVNGGTLVLNENAQVMSGLSESFVVPAGVDTLQFTVLADHLLANSSGNPPDAFEAALLDQNGNPLNGSAVGLSNTDSFLNIQSNGQIFFGPGVTVSGHAASGDAGSLSSPITVTEDLSGVAVGTTLTLYFDLIGFGSPDSSVTVNVSPSQTQALDAHNITANVQETGPAQLIAASFSDADANGAHSFTIDKQTDGTKGTVINNGDGTFTYDPNHAFDSLKAGATATDQFRYTVTDDAGELSTALVTVTIHGENEAPVAHNIATGANEHGPAVVVTPSYDDVDNGDTHSFTVDVVTDGTKGKVISNSNGTFSYDPNGAFVSLKAGATATDQFRYTVKDGSGASSTATVTVTITGQNDAPVAMDIGAGVSQLGPAVKVTAQYTDADNSDTHTFTVDTTTDGTKGRVINNGDGTFSYDPAGAFSLPLGTTTTDKFLYTVKDGSGAVSTATVTVTITAGPNHAPVAQDVVADVDEHGPAIKVTLPYSDPDIGDTDSITIDSAGVAKGKITNNGDGTFTYDPKNAFAYLGQGETAIDTFSFTVTDAAGASSTAAVKITIDGENDAPVAQDLVGKVNEHGPGVVFTANYADPDTTDSHTFAVNILTDKTRGTVTNNSDGTFTYDPNGAFIGLKAGETATDKFLYTVKDGFGGISSATVTVTIIGQNDAPVAQDVAADVNEHGPAVKVKLPYSDPDIGDTDSITIDSAGVAKGKITNNGDGTFTYDPKNAFAYLGQGETAIDTFSFTVTDAAGASSTAAVKITIDGENDAPVAQDLVGKVNEHGPGVVFTANYTDPDTTDSHTFAVDILTDKTRGKVTNNGDGTFTYDPNGAFTSLKAGETATDKFVYTVEDGFGGISSATVTVTIIGQNDAPVAKDVAVNVLENGPAKQVIASYSDPDEGDNHSFTINAAGATGNVVNNGDGTFTYDPNGAFTSLKVGATATDKFLYTVKDGSGLTSTATVTITIIGQNEAPIVTSAPQSTALTEDAQKSGTEIGSGTIVFVDPDEGDVHTASAISQANGYVGQFTLNTSKHDTGGGGSIGWTFSVPDSAIQHLAVGQTLIQKYTVQIDDGNGGRALETVTVSISGTNDAPTISGGSSRNIDVKVDEDDRGAVVASGVIAFGDVDATDKHVVSVKSHDIDGHYFGTLDVTMVSDATGGAQGTAQWTYRLSGQAPDLDKGQKLVQVYDITVDDGHGGRATQTLTITLVGEERQNDHNPPLLNIPCDVKFDAPPTYPEFNLHGLDPVSQAHLDGLPYMTFVAYSGWLSRSGDVNTKSIDGVRDDDINYCPMPTPFTPFSRFTPSDIEKQLQLPGLTNPGVQLEHKPFGASEGPPSSEDATPGAPNGNSVARPSAVPNGSPHTQRLPATQERGRAGTARHDDTQHLMATVGAFAAPMVLWQSARKGLRHAREVEHERNLGVSFTSAGGVRSVVFKLSYDPERVAVTGVRPGKDLPDTASAALSCVVNDGTAIAHIVVTMDEEDLVGGTVNLASLSVRYLGEFSDDAVKLLSVDVNGDDACNAQPVRLSIDSVSRLRSEDEPEESTVPQRRAARAGTFTNAIRISIASLESGAARAAAVVDDDADIQAAVRIAVEDVMAGEGIVTRQEGERDHLRKADKQRRVDEAAAGGVRIPAALLARNGVPGPRISIP